MRSRVIIDSRGCQYCVRRIPLSRGNRLSFNNFAHRFQNSLTNLPPSTTLTNQQSRYRGHKRPLPLPPGQIMRLLFADNHLPMRKSISAGLRKAGYAVDLAHDGEDALAYALTSEYDVVVLDVVLPVLDGLSVLRKLRSKDPAPHVLIVSAKASVADRIRGLDAGADDYLVKPFVFEELLARIRALTRRKYGQKAPIVRIGDLEIDTAARRVWRKEDEILFTRREYALLEYLAMRRGETVYRGEIWDHVYDFADTRTSNVVDVYIGYLRKKIDLPGEPSLIRTVRGRGYTLDAKRRPSGNARAHGLLGEQARE